MSHLLTPRRRGLLAAVSLLPGLLTGCLGPEATPTGVVPPTATTGAAAPATATSLPPTATTAAPPNATTAAAAPPTATTAAAAPPTVTTVAGAVTPVVVGPRVAAQFAAYTITNTQVTPAVPAYTVKPDLSNVRNAKNFTFSSAQTAALAENAFVVVPPRNVQASEVQPVYRQFYQLYEDGRYDAQPVFVTTDSVLHVYHLMFDKLLRSTETRFLIGDVEALTKAMNSASQAQLAALAGTPGESAARRNVAYFAVAAKLLDPNAAVPAAVADDVSAELAQIEAHAGISKSRLFADYDEDYSQFVPRGHYTRNDDLKRYFKAMMWYGQMTFRLKDADETRSALLLATALQTASADGKKAGDLWAQIYEPTVFFVGAADDLTFRDYQPLIAQVFGSTPDPAAFVDAAKIAQFQTQAKALASPRINSLFIYIDENVDTETKGLRFMGQRFTIDEYVLGQLLYRNVGTLDKPRLLPKALDVPAALGSGAALQILDQSGETAYEHYGDQLTKVRGQLAGLPDSQWTENLYWGWIYTFRPLLQPHTEAGYPTFMRSSAWNQKELNTVAGSWTELKHDTLLYAKQVMAEAGGGPPDQIKGYVEPYPDFYARIAALVHMTNAGLTQRGLLDAQMAGPLTDLETLANELHTISVKELKNQALTSDEYDMIQYYGAAIEHMTLNAADVDGDQGNPVIDDQDSALVADVASSPESLALEEATGHPTPIYVVVSVDGALVIARGGVYSHYEFTVPFADRMTDETWRAQLNANKAPALPTWTGSFIKP